MASERREEASRRVTRSPKKRVAAGVVRLTGDEAGVLPEALDSTDASKQLAVEVVRCVGEFEDDDLTALRLAIEGVVGGLVLVVDGDQGFQLDDIENLLKQFARDPAVLGETGLHVRSASLFPWEALGSRDKLLKARELAERAAGLRQVTLTSSPNLLDAPVVSSGRRSTIEQRQEHPLAKLREAFDQVKSRAQGDADFAGESIELLEKMLSELRSLTVEARSLANEEIRTGAGPHEPLMSARETIERLKEIQEPGEIEQFLERFVVGKTWGNLESNHLIATGITDHLRSIGLRVACRKDEEPAVLRCYAEGNNPNGSFKFEHKGGERHGGTTTVPFLKLVEAPAKSRPGRRRKSQDAS